MMRRWLALCGSAVLLASCGGADGDAAGGRLPPAPAGVTAEAGSATSVHVMWNAAGEDVAAYEVLRDGRKVREVPGSTRMVDVTRLRPSTVYVFSVRARDADGRVGPRSAEVRATTPADDPADTSPPGAPDGLRGTALGGRMVQLTWTAAQDDRRVVSYDIEQGGTPVHRVGGNQTGAVVTGLRPGTRYAFTVRARDAADNVSPPSAVVRVTMPGHARAASGTAPSGFRAEAREGDDGAHHAHLSWVPPRVDGTVSEYEVHLDGRPATAVVFGGTPPKDRARHSFYLGRDPGETHRVRLRARLPDGTWGAFTAERTVTTGQR